MGRANVFRHLTGMWMGVHAIPGARDEQALYSRMYDEEGFGFGTPYRVSFDSVGKGIDWLRKRLSIPQNVLDEVEREAEEEGFSLAGDFSEATLDRIKESLARSFDAGDNQGKWKEDVDRILGDDGFAAGRAETIFRTESQNAQQAGLREELTDPAYDGWIAGYEYITMDDDRVRPNHAAMHGCILRPGSRAVDIWWPPNGYNCRCQLLPIDKLEAKRGITYTDPLPDVDPDPGFSKPPGGLRFAL